MESHGTTQTRDGWKTMLGGKALDRPAAAPMTESGFTETADYARFKARVFQKTGIDLNLYKQQQMHRRLLNMVERANARDFMEYFDIIERNPQEFAAFLDRMTINVSELFRNPEKWRDLREKILPPMLARKRALKIWSAGCSYGAEPYSLAILLDQMTPGVQHTLHATDLDQKILAKAKEGLFSDADIKNIDAATFGRYFTRLPARPSAGVPDAGPTCQVKPEIRARVTFRAHNLLADKFDSGYDLICCRNVVIYFTDEAKDRLYARFCEALAPEGVLFVGGTERIFNFREIGFASPQPFFYQRNR
ncbi:MAG TPA: protein-glutamate O-methyltransferase CheR [Chthonomonadaceae bacterium]|nr:protein-glutamate O-methyltransferase CheR [Chthonomonadaceae bacterium]